MATTGNPATSQDRSDAHSHINSHSFAELFRLLDSSTLPRPKKRPRRSTDLGSEVTASGKRLSIAEWAKAKAQVRLSAKETVRSITSCPTTAVSAVDPLFVPSKHSSSSSGPATYSPFSKFRLLNRVATFPISTYNVNARVHDMVPQRATPEQARTIAKELSELVRWLDPIGPALHGWTHLAPPEGGKNRINCETCSATQNLPFEPIRDLNVLLETIRALQTAHRAWCPWQRRACDPQLYSLGGTHSSPADSQDRYVVRCGSRVRTRKTFRNKAVELESVVSSTTQQPSASRMALPSSLTAESLQQLEQILSQTSRSMSLGEDETLEEPSLSRDAILLALYGWTPFSPGPGSDLFSRGPTPPRAPLVSCDFCGRRVNLGPLTLGKSGRLVNPEQEHRPFCPWINAETQEGSWLPQWTDVLAACTSDAAEDSPKFPPGADSIEASAAALVEQVQPGNDDLCHDPLQRQARSCARIFPSREPHSELHKSRAGWRWVFDRLVDTSFATTRPSAAADQVSTCTSGDTLTRTETRPSQQRTSEVLKEAKALLYGLGGPGVMGRH